MIEKIVKDKNDRECNSCRSTIDVKSIKIGLTVNFMSSLALCKACRSLFHKRLHEEEKESDNT